jgi:uncharacterized protein (DUF2252 family)
MSRTYPKPPQRPALLSQRRNLKMTKSAHAYVRGSTVRFYEWLKETDHALPQGPKIWICGDCHVSNIGPVADAEGHVDVQIRDLDQTVVGNPAHDLIRLGLSLSMSARGSALPGIVTARMMEQLVEGYELALERKAGKRKNALKRPDSVQVVVKKAMRRKWKHLAAERIEGIEPNIPLSRSYWPISSTERAALKQLVSTEKVRLLVTSLGHRGEEDAVELLDAAYWVKGCSSLGLLRYAALLRVGDARDAESSLCLLDIKEAVKPAAPKARNAPMPEDNAQRVVQGATALSPHLGERMAVGKLLDHSVFIRELLPQDLKLDIDELTQAEAMQVAAYLGNIVGRAHAAQMDTGTRAGWLEQLRRHRSATMDAPSWLWLSVVDLVKEHEGAYLDHCRKFAMGEDREAAATDD